MRVVRGYPPNIDEIRAALNPTPTTIYAYGDAIYDPDPDERPIPDHLLAHERVHLGQQARCGGPEAWWRRYIDEPAFRLEQEVEAYRAQYQHLVASGTGRPERRLMLAWMARCLSGPMYGRLVTAARARSLVLGDRPPMPRV